MTRSEDVYRHPFGYLRRSWRALRLSWVAFSSLVSRLVSLSLSLSLFLSLSLSLSTSLDPLIIRQETKIIAENLRTHKNLKFQNWPGSVLINSEMLQFPALLEHTLFRLLPILLLLLLILLLHLLRLCLLSVFLVVFFFCWIMKLTIAQA